VIKLDIHIAHDSRVLRDNIVGEFCGSPIITLDELGIAADEQLDLNRRLKFSTGTSVPAEVLPGEEICSDGIIRRVTTAEAVGYDTYHNQEAIEEDTLRVTIDSARSFSKGGQMVYWRPNSDVSSNAYALIQAGA
jgi:hypothetical protein